MAFDTGIVNDSCYTIYDIKLVDGNKLLKVSERSERALRKRREYSRKIPRNGYRRLHPLQN